MKKWMVYGANGYTGRLITRDAVERGMHPLPAGRDKDQIAKVAVDYSLDYEVLDLRYPKEMRHVLEKVDVVLHCAGPFSATAEPMLDACLDTGTHYLDITGEIDVFEHIASRRAEIEKAGIVAVPGVGFDVAPTDCVAMHLKQQMPDAQSLALALEFGGSASRGTAKTMVESLKGGGRVRRDGKLETVPFAYKTREVQFAGCKRSTVTIPWGDVSTAFHTTGIPNIEVYMAMQPPVISALKSARLMAPVLGLSAVQNTLKGIIGMQPPGPTCGKRAVTGTSIFGEVTNAAGESKTARMITPNGYETTVNVALAVLNHLLESDLKPGFYTPAMLMGSDFVTQLPGIEWA